LLQSLEWAGIWFSEQGLVSNMGSFGRTREEKLMGLRVFAYFHSGIHNVDLSAPLWMLASGLISIYLRSYQFGLMVLRLLQ